MEICSDCGKETTGGSITGKDKATGETKTLCWNCFKGYKLVKSSKTNIFVKKKGGR